MLTTDTIDQRLGGELFDGREGEARTLQQVLDYVGPVAQKFTMSTSFIAIIMGPYGSAKTTSGIMRIIWATMWQVPGPDGVRRSRGCIVRETYGQLKSNIMADFFEIFPKTKENFNGDEMKSTIRLELPNWGQLEIEILWRALGEDNKPEKLFKGMQLTWLWLNESDTLYRQVLKFGMPRVGRYPSKRHGGCRWAGIWMDMNAPDVLNWMYDLAVNKNWGLDEDELAAMQEIYGADFDIQFFRQPGGLSPDAENKKNLSPGYYERLKLQLSEQEQQRFIHNKFGVVRNGQPVYPEYNDDFHTAKEVLQYDKGRMIYIGVDGGSTPAAAFGQKMPDGQIRIVGEHVILSPDDDQQLAKMGPRAFGKATREFINENFPDAKIGRIWSDPAAGYADYEDSEDLCWRDDFEEALGLPVEDAPLTSNRITPRLEAVRSSIENNVSGQPGILVSPNCKILRWGFNSEYIFGKHKLSTGQTKLKDDPDKKCLSGHVHDALQYLMLGLKEVHGAVSDLDRRRAARKQGKGVQYGGYAGAGK